MRINYLRRWEFIALLSGMAAWPLAARAQQQPAKIARIGYLGFATAAGDAPRVEALRTGLRDLGYVEGKNIVIEFRVAERIELLQELEQCVWDRESFDFLYRCERYAPDASPS